VSPLLMLFQFLLAASPTTLPATERGTLPDNLGGSDPRRRRRWAAEKPLKVGSLPPKIRCSPRSAPMLRRRSSLSFPATSTCGQQKSGRKSVRKVASGPLRVPEASFCAAPNVATRRFNVLEYIAVRSSRSGNLLRSAAGNLRQAVSDVVLRTVFRAIPSRVSKDRER
jgi:hypothetical protein